MTLSLKRKESVRAALERVACKRIDVTLDLLDRAMDADADDRIHAARKQLKQLRALLRLLGHDMQHKGCAHADHCLRDVARTLSKVRDSTVMKATLRGLQQQGAITPALFRALWSTLEIQWQRSCKQMLSSPARRKSLTQPLRQARRRILDGSSIHSGWRAIGPGLDHVHRAARIAAAAIATHATDEVLHDCRKRTKDLLYVAEFLRPLRPGALQIKIDAARRLEQLLGEDHDLAVLESALRGRLHSHLRPAERLQLKTTLTRQRRALQRAARTVALTLYDETDDAFVSRLHRYWRQWRRA